MPATVECHGVPAGLTLTASIFPDGNDTAAASGIACTEATNRKTTYTFSANVTGLHLIQLSSSSTRVWVGWAVLATSGTIVAADDRQSAKINTGLEADGAVYRCTENFLEQAPAGGGGGGSSEVESFTDEALLQLRQSLRNVLVVVRGPFIDSDDDDSTAPTLSLVIGDDYLNVDGRAVEFDLEGSSLPTTLVGAMIILRLRSVKSDDAIEIEGEATVPTGATRTIRFEPTAAETALLTKTGIAGKAGEYDVQITDAEGHVITPEELRGVLNCLKPLD